MKKFVLVLLSVLLCLSMFSCDGNVVTPSSSEDTSSQEVTSKESVSSVEDISSVNDTSSQEVTSSESVSSIEDTSSEETVSDDGVKADFVKVQVGILDYEFLTLDSKGVLYAYEEDTDTFDIVMKDVEDFSYTENGGTCYILQKNKEMTIIDIRDGDTLQKLFENAGYRQALENIEYISGSLLILKDGTVKEYDFSSNSWLDRDINYKRVIAGTGFAYTDQNDDLWVWESLKDTPVKVAEDVISFDYIPGDKVFYTDDLWYITKDNKTHLMCYTGSLSDDTFYNWSSHSSSNNLPNDVIEIFAHKYGYIARKTDGTLIYGKEYSKDAHTIDVNAVSVDVYYMNYAMLGEDGKIYYGTLPMVLQIPYEEIKYEFTIKCVEHP